MSVTAPPSRARRSRLARPAPAGATLALSLLLAACGGSGGSKTGSVSTAGASGRSAGHAAVVIVDYHNIEIVPSMLTVKVGTTVRWDNMDDVDHNVTSENGPAHFASQDFGQGGSFEYTFNTPGVVNYECSIHPTTMQGQITVVK